MSDKVMEKFNELALAIHAEKPNDRSDRDRHYAICLTDLEKLAAYYQVFLWKVMPSADEATGNTRQTE